MISRTTFFQIDDSWRSATGRGVSVAVIDSGIDTAHPELDGKVKTSVEARVDNKRIVFDPSEAGDSAGHGTACASIISRIAPDAELHSIKVLGAGGLGDGQAFLAGLEYAVKNKLRVINLSLGTTKPSSSHRFTICSTELILRAAWSWRRQTICRIRAFRRSFVITYLRYQVEEMDPLKFGFHFGEIIELTARVSTSVPLGPAADIELDRQQFCLSAFAGPSPFCSKTSGTYAVSVKSALYAIAQENQSNSVSD